MKCPNTKLLVLLSLGFAACNNGGGGGGGGSGGGGGASAAPAEDSNDEYVYVDDRPFQFIEIGEQLIGNIQGAVYAGSSMLGFRSQHAMIALSDGRIVTYGGRYASALFGNHDYSDIVIYSPTQDTWTRATNASRYRYYIQMATTGSDKVLLGSGSNAEIFDPADNSIHTISGDGCASTIIRDAAYIATSLQDGRILLSGGNGGSTSSFEIFDESRGAYGCFSQVAQSSVYRHGHRTTLLPDGRVFLAGGYDNGAAHTAAIFDPSDNTVSELSATMAMGRAGHGQIRLNDGRILLAGGYFGYTTIGSGEIYDPVSNTFTSTQNDLTHKRNHPFMYLVPSGSLQGKVLVVGGSPEDNSMEAPPIEIFDPQTNRFSVSTFATSIYRYAAIAGTNDGKLIVTGGYYGTNNNLIFDFSVSTAFYAQAFGGVGNPTYEVVEGEGTISQTTGLFKKSQASGAVTVRATDQAGTTILKSFYVNVE